MVFIWTWFRRNSCADFMHTNMEQVNNTVANIHKFIPYTRYVQRVRIWKKIWVSASHGFGRTMATLECSSMFSSNLLYSAARVYELHESVPAFLHIFKLTQICWTAFRCERLVRCVHMHVFVRNLWKDCCTWSRFEIKASLGGERLKRPYYYWISNRNIQIWLQTIGNDNLPVHAHNDFLQ